MPVPIHALPVAERPRERLLAHGVEALSAVELLALVLRQGRAGESALELAGSLLAEYGSLDSLAAVRPEELAKRPGMGAAKASALLAALRLRHVDPGRDGRPVLRSSADVAAVAQRELAGLRRERVIVLVCDSGNRLLRTVTITEGSVDRSLLPVREILNAVLRHDGRAFAVAHNHPNGDPAPTMADRDATAQVADAARAVGLRFLDRVIAGHERTASAR